MINLQWLELSMSRINFHGPKDIEALIFFFFFFFFFQFWYRSTHSGIFNNCFSAEADSRGVLGSIKYTAF